MNSKAKAFGLIMMENIEKHVILYTKSVREALVKLDALAADAILFVVDAHLILKGSLTDGDLRRGFIRGLNFETSLLDFVQPSPKFIYEKEYNLEQLEEFKSKHFKVIPIVNAQQVIVGVLNFRTQTTLIPADAVLMAGGQGKRLLPLTLDTPKPLLKVGEKPIIEYNIDKLKNVGINNIFISINYLGNKIESYFGDGKDKALSIQYLREDQPMGTIGAILLAKNFAHDDIIVMNSDLLTNLDFADFFKIYKASNAAMAVAAISYHVDVPYAVLEVNDYHQVKSLKEKPRYTYFSNAGIYIMKKEILALIPQNQYYDVTDLMEKVIALDMKLITYPINGYWLDIGKPEDYRKAQEDIKHLKL